jgi:dihydroxy-acid dehydratase
MAIATEALGLSLAGAASIPAVDSSHSRLATASGRRIVEMVLEDQRPRDVLTAEAFDNAIRAVMSAGGSTNALIHLVAMAGRAGVELALERFDSLSRTTPRLANIRPSGEYLMEDFHYAGGLRGLMARLSDLLHLEAPTVAGGALRESLEGALVHNDAVIATREKPLGSEGGLAVLRGNLAPDGAVIKHSAMEPRLRRHSGKAIVFSDYTTSTAGSTIPRSARQPTRCWCCRTPARSADRACPSGACCRSRSRSCSRACATCCGSRTRA